MKIKDYLAFLLTLLVVAACGAGNHRLTPMFNPVNKLKTAQTKHYCQYAYVNHNMTNNIKSFGINQLTGALESLHLPLIPTGNSPGSFYTHPTGNYVYVLAGNDNSITTYKINHNTGQLTLIDTDISPGYMLWGGVLTPRSGKYFYVCNNKSNNITMYRVDPESGGLTLNKTKAHPNGLIADAPNGIGPNSIKITANLKWAYVGNYDSNNIAIYHYDDRTGDLILAESHAINVANCVYLRQIMLSPVAMPNDPTYVPPPRQLYALCQGSSTIVKFDLNNDQLIIPNSHPSIVSTNGISAASMSIDIEYKYLYVTNMKSNTIAQFSINFNTGLLSSLEPPVVKGGFENKGIYTNMGYAYVTNFGANTVSTFKIESNGTLTKSGNDIPTDGVNPGNITFTPLAKECK